MAKALDDATRAGNIDKRRWRPAVRRENGAHGRTDGRTSAHGNRRDGVADAAAIVTDLVVSFVRARLGRDPNRLSINSAGVEAVAESRLQDAAAGRSPQAAIALPATPSLYHP